MLIAVVAFGGVLVMVVRAYCGFLLIRCCYNIGFSGFWVLSGAFLVGV